MGMFDGCLLGCDIDGTLIINGYINPRNIEKIKFFMDEGGCFSLSTGRTLAACSDVLNQIKDISPSVVANGCMIYDFKNNKSLYEVFIPKKDYEIFKIVKEKFPRVGIEAHAGKDILTVNRTSETDDHQRYESLNGIDVTFDEACSYNINKLVYLFSNDEDIDGVKKLINSIDNNCSFIDTSATLYGRKRNYYEQTPVNISKSVTLDRLASMLNIKRGCKFAIGDYYNDLEMIQNADLSAVPSETPDDIKAYADYICGKCKDGAVADFIDYLVERFKSSAIHERMDKMDAAAKKELQITACKVRMGIIEGVHSAKAGHPGGSLSSVEILTYLYFKQMNIDPKNPKMENRDRFVLSKGHAAPALYAVLAERGYFDVSLLKTLRQIGSILQGHPDMKHIPGVDMSTGSLGQGISAACGMALSSKHYSSNFDVYSVLGDGEIEEGQVWEAAMFAANKGLDNLTVFVDNNNLQIDGTIDEVNSAKPIDKKFEAFNWYTITIDGNDFDQIEAALKEAKTVNKPVAIIAKTVKGKGVSYMENAVNWHGAAPNDELYEQAMKELNSALAELQ